FATERAVAIDAVLHAIKICQKVLNNLLTNDTVIKKDKSPTTKENSKKLQGDSEEKIELRDKILTLANSVLDTSLNEKEGTYTGGPHGRMWTIDPVDGTRGFIRGGYYAVGISLIIDGDVHLSVIGCPNFPVDFKAPESEKGCIFIAVKGQGAFQRKFSSIKETQIHVIDIIHPSEALFCESFEAEHSSHEDSASIASLLKITKPPLRMDSMCKYCAVARGDADIYLRLPPANFEMPIWVYIIRSRGTVSDMDNKSLDFTLSRKLKANRGIVVASSKLHEQIVCAKQHKKE
ncbi:9433_t:CDS:2, partial [Dentiscutata erythropus]